MEKYVTKILTVLEEALADAKEEGRTEASSEFFALLQGMKQPGGKRSKSFLEAKGALKAAVRAPKKVGHRTKEDMEATEKAILAYIKKNPDQRIEKISVGMGTPTKELKHPIQKLVEAKTVQRKGQRRGATYRVKE